MSVHLTDESRFHSWEANSCPEVGAPSDSAFFNKAGDRAFLMNEESPREFIFCKQSMLMKIRR